MIATSDNNGNVSYNSVFTSGGIAASDYWSGFNSDWTVGANNCSGWTDGGGGVTGLAGDGVTNVPCNAINRPILCIQLR
ncbi:DUF1554 domain-containing protein [Leptospira ellisii]|uniref:DUF1554 domain-containing protein n=1 Tax=Leptospira ellisii TaxID=2023197 RepID=UPI0013FD661F|nr:DUF1554 domain-containing protein [Leptospira ellisii]